MVGPIRALPFVMTQLATNPLGRARENWRRGGVDWVHRERHDAIASGLSYRVARYRCRLGSRQVLTSMGASVGVLQRYDATRYQAEKVASHVCWLMEVIEGAVRQHLVVW